MKVLTYRNAEEKDLPKIVEIYNSTVASRLVTADTEEVSVESKMKWFDEHHPNTRPLWMVEDDFKNCIGWVSFQNFYGRPAYNSTAEISIYLDEKFRGQGFGKKILQYSIQQAPSLGIKTILGFIFSHNLPSMKLFLELGFEEWAHLPEIAEMDANLYGLKIVGKKVGK